MNIMKIIIYASQYGSTKEYADELSKRTGIEAVEYTEITDINQYDTLKEQALKQWNTLRLQT